MIVKYCTVGGYATNCYLLGDEEAKVCALIDPGDDAPQVEAMLAQSGLELKAIFLTHGHSDHTGAVEALVKDHPGTPVYLHKADDVDDPANFGRLPAGILRFYDDGDTLAVGGLEVAVLHTPGHSKGSVTLQVGDVLFTGDTLFAGSMGRTDFTGGSYPEIMASLARLGALEGDFHVCPGHMGLSTLEKERGSNYYLREAMGRA